MIYDRKPLHNRCISKNFACNFQKHQEWLKKRAENKLSAGYIESDDPYQKIKYFKKLIKFKNQNEASANEISFVPHLNEAKDVIDRTRVEATTTAVIDAGNKFAYDTINAHNEDAQFAGSNATKSGLERGNNPARVNEVVEQPSTEPSTNIINENNEKQESAIDISNNIIKSQMEGSSKEQQIGNGVDTENHRNVFVSTTASSMDSKNAISAVVANNTSTEKNSNDWEIQRFISEHIKYKSNNITIKKSWGKWSAWSSCSRSCGEGVMAQSRECTEKM